MNHTVNRFVAITCLSLAVLAGASTAHAEEPTSLGKFEGWEALTYQAEDSAVCYVFAAPSKTEASRKVKRSEVYFMITHWPGRKIKGQPSTLIGYPFKAESDVVLTIGDKKFQLYPVDDMAWTDKAETEKAILTAMKSGSTMSLAGASARGTETTDTYSLAGFSAALQKIDSACK